MEKKGLELLNIFYRYVLLLAIVLISSFSNIFYEFFLRLTIYPVSWLLDFFYSSSVFKSIIFVNSYSIELIPACIAVSAYLLLLILNITLSMPIKKRIYSIIFSFFLLLALNILRIFIFSLLLINNYKYFNQLHEFFWYFLSIILVIGIWFLTAYVFKIKNIPIYTDIKSIKINIKC
jgi:exosortase/archaeosortase family protein